jgi:hypothetical protein
VSWKPPERPEWVAAINADRVPLFSEEAALPLERDALLAEARARLGLLDAGLADYGAPGFETDGLVEAMDRVLGALEEEAALTTMGRWMTRRFVLRLLEVRLQLMGWLRADPGVRDEPIERPLFVAGAPRTGTTILHALLAADPRHRVPLGWELLRPVPPPDPDPVRFARDPRIELADRELVLPQTVVSGLLAIHAYGARQPKECLSAMSFSFLTEEFTARYRIPSYEAWLEQADPTPAYEMHKLVLQLLQRRTGRADWVLKSPVHLHTLPTLFRVYPDARVAITHRDPLTVLASLSSLIATLRYAHSDTVDLADIGASHARRYQATFRRLVDDIENRRLPLDQLHHSRYADFMTDATGVVEELYRRFDRTLSPETAALIRAAHDARPKGVHGEHDYRFEDLGLSAASERKLFGGYCEAFDLAEEEIP